MATSIKDIKSIQDLKGAQAIRGEFYLVANKGSARETALGFTQEGTFSVEREYRDASQNQTVSGVKGLVYLDSASVMFETASLQLEEGLLTELKGFEKGSFTDNDGTVYSEYKEPAFVSWDKYINTLDLMFEFQDGRTGAIRMFNVLDKSSESIAFSRTDDTTISVQFEATIDENDNDEYLPYTILIEDESIEALLDRAASQISKEGWTVTDTTSVETIETELKGKVDAYLSTFDDFKTAGINLSAAVLDELVDAEVGTFVKVTATLTDSGATITKDTLLGITII